jgi:GntR family transcriptional regulator
VFLSVDPSSGFPVYRQIMDQVRRMIVAGRLTPGEKLPSIRDLAATLQINPLTVGKAYTELERGGIVEMRRGLGMYIRRRGAHAATDVDDAPATVTGGAQRFVLEAAQAGLSRAHALKVVDDAWQELVTGPVKNVRRQR